MAFFSESLGSFFTRVRPGLTIIAIFAVIRFLMLPVFGIPYAQGTNFASVFIVAGLVIAFYTLGHARDAGGYKDLLAIVFVVILCTNLLVVIGIALDEGLGIDTYYTDPAHGGSQSVLSHMVGHLVFASIIGSLFYWILASILYTITKPLLNR